MSELKSKIEARKAIDNGTFSEKFGKGKKSKAKTSKRDKK